MAASGAAAIEVHGLWKIFGLRPTTTWPASPGTLPLRGRGRAVLRPRRPAVVSGFSRRAGSGMGPAAGVTAVLAGTMFGRVTRGPAGARRPRGFPRSSRTSSWKFSRKKRIA